MSKTQIPTAFSIAIARFEEANNLKFQPNPTFYSRVGINRIRFWQLVRGEKPPYSTEVVALADYFKIPVSDILRPIMAPAETANQ